MSVAFVGYGSLYFLDNPIGNGMFICAALIGAAEMFANLSATSLIGKEAPERGRGAVLGMWSWCGAFGILVVALVGCADRPETTSKPKNNDGVHLVEVNGGVAFSRDGNWFKGKLYWTNNEEDPWGRTDGITNYGFLDRIDRDWVRNIQFENLEDSPQFADISRCKHDHSDPSYALFGGAS